jgi:hypothetical protein
VRPGTLSNRHGVIRTVEVRLLGRLVAIIVEVISIFCRIGLGRLLLSMIPGRSG